MSADPTINAALLNMCAQVQDTGNAARAAETNAVGAAPPSALTLAPAAAAAATATGTSANASGSTAPTSNAPPARPASDYAWLRSALQSVEAPEKRVKQLLFQMEDKTADGTGGPLSSAERLEALEELSDTVEDVNWAAEFALMDGPQRLLRALRQERSTHPLVPTTNPTAAAARAEKDKAEGGSAGEATLSGLPLYTQLAMIVAHSSQLNEPLQTAYQAAHWEDVVLPLLHDTLSAVQEAWGDVSESKTDVELQKAAVSTSTKLTRLIAALLHACSCLCRECPPNTILFLQHGGLAALADVLKMTRSTTASLSATTTTTTASAEVPVAVTTIHDDIARAESADTVDYEPFLSSANRVTSRVFFFAAYLASTGVSSEDVIRLTCQHAEENDDAMVQKAAARELLELVAKSPKATKEAVHTYMPKRFYQWKSQLQHAAGEEWDSYKDERQQFVEALDSSN